MVNFVKLNSFSETVFQKLLYKIKIAIQLNLKKNVKMKSALQTQTIQGINWTKIKKLRN